MAEQETSILRASSLQWYCIYQEQLKLKPKLIGQTVGLQYYGFYGQVKAAPVSH